MTPSSDLRWRAAYAVGAVAGVASLVAVQNLAWRETEYEVGLGVRWVIALAGVLVLGVAARGPRTGRVGVAMLALGLSVATYPALLTVSAAASSPVVQTLGNAGHVVPLTMVQLLPVLVSEQATGRARRGWVLTILGVAAGGGLLTAIGLAAGDSGTPMLVAATVLWFASFAFAPIASWSAIRGTSGHARRRGVVAGLAAIVPVLVIVWCVSLGGLGTALALADSATTTALFLGFAAATAGCAVLSVVALSDLPSPLLGRAVVVGAMRAMVVAVVALVASGLALASATLLPTGEAAVLVAVALTVLLGWWATRLFGWAATVVDPAAELRLELDRASGLVAGRHRQVAESVVRRLAADDRLTLAFAVGGGSWVDVSSAPAAPDLARSVALVHEEPDTPVVLLVSRSAEARAHARAWGDCSAALRPALMEAREEWQAGRAAMAADQERSRLQQDLHDGLQGRLLGSPSTSG